MFKTVYVDKYKTLIKEIKDDLNEIYHVLEFEDSV